MVNVEALLKHMVNMTCQRDHALLDSAVVSALRDLAGARQVHVNDLLDLRGELFLRPRAWIRNGRIVSSEEDPEEGDACGEPLSAHPALVEGIRQRQSRIEETATGGERLLWLPIWLNDKVSTCIEITDPTPCNDETMRVIDGILGVYRNYQNILDYSERDSLTGLLNRKTFDEKFSRLLSSVALAGNLPEGQDRRSHSGSGHWLAVVDIDHFKRVNDQFGHLYGDEVLILVANLLRASFRSQDRVFRFGGEEFVVLLRSTTLEDARKIFERFRQNVERHEFPQVGRVTVSMGFTSITNESPVVILGHADQALYYAKASGRNRVCYYDELVESGQLHAEISNDTVEFF